MDTACECRSPRYIHVYLFMSKADYSCNYTILHVPVMISEAGDVKGIAFDIRFALCDFLLTLDASF